MKPLMCTLIATAAVLSWPLASLAEEPVYFADANLKAAVETALGVTNPTPTDMLALNDYLYVGPLGITDITGIEYAVNLTGLGLGGNPISDVTPLAGLTKLTALELYETQTSDLSLLAGLTSLTHLNLDDNQINDISPLSGLTELLVLRLARNQVSDLSPLASLTKLDNLRLYSNPISDISALAGLTSLTRLGLTDAGISDISPLAGLVNLVELQANFNQIADISALSGLSNLVELSLADNQIEDISVLAGLTNLQQLWLYANQIHDISALSSLVNLSQLAFGLRSGVYNGGNQVSDISPLAALNQLTIVYLQVNPLNAEAYSLYIPQITANNPGIHLYYDAYSAMAVYRFWSPTLSRHFYTIDAAERDKLINLYSYAWTYEGTAYYAFADAYEAGLVPVYRFWSPTLNGHFYTTSETERDNLINTYSYVWTYEGVAFYAYPEAAYPAEAKPIFRFWSDQLSGHFYTMDEAERDKLINIYSYVWTYEGIAWYALEEP